jgi:polyribonucleotide nucleotidyltransferase
MNTTKANPIQHFITFSYQGHELIINQIDDHVENFKYQISYKSLIGYINLNIIPSNRSVRFDGYAPFNDISVHAFDPLCAYGNLPGGFYKRESKRPMKDEDKLLSRLIGRTLKPTTNKMIDFNAMLHLEILSNKQEDNPVGPMATAAAIIAYRHGITTTIPYTISFALENNIGDTLLINQRSNNVFHTIFTASFCSDGAEPHLVAISGSSRGIKYQNFDSLLQSIYRNNVAQDLEKLWGNSVIKSLKAQRQAEFAELNIAYQSDYKQIQDLFSERLREFIAEKVASQQLDPKFKFEFLADISTEQFEQNCRSSLIPKMVSAYISSALMVPKRIPTNTFPEGRGNLDIRENLLYFIAANTNNSVITALYDRETTKTLITVILSEGATGQLCDKSVGTVTHNFLVNYQMAKHNFSVTDAHDTKMSRRELGHGEFVRKALGRVLTCDLENMVLSLNSNVICCDGSTSLATATAGGEILYKMGLIQEPVAGISVSFVEHESSNKLYLILDMKEIEDHISTMDFKVIGSASLIHGIQMDSDSLNVIPFSRINEVLINSQTGMKVVLSSIKSSNFPAVTMQKTGQSFSVDVDMMGIIIGKAGKNINYLTEKYNVKIKLDKISGLCAISGEEQSSINCMNEIKTSLNKPKEGTVYVGIAGEQDKRRGEQAFQLVNSFWICYVKGSNITRNAQIEIKITDAKGRFIMGTLLK